MWANSHACSCLHWYTISDSRRYNIAYRVLVEGERSTMSPACLCNYIRNWKCDHGWNGISISSTSIANRQRDMVPSCLTPALRTMKLETWVPHLTQVIDISSHLSISWIMLRDNCLFISLISNAWWFILSNAFDKSILQMLMVKQPAINLSTTLRTE